MRIVSICAAMLVLGGCAAQEPVVTSATAPMVIANSDAPITEKTKLTCHKEMPTGSQMIRTVCETEQTEAERQAKIDKVLNSIQIGAHGTGH